MMALPRMPAMHANAPPDQACEAARYAVLRRVGSALRHDLVVNLQALGMLTEVVANRLERGLPPLADLQHQLARIQRTTREALAQSLRVAAWLVPPEDDSLDLRTGLQECLALVRGGLEHRGFSLQVEWPAAGFEVSGTLVRPLLLAALLHLSDQARAPSELQVSGRAQANRATLTLACPAANGNGGCEAMELDLPYRPLAAFDVQALAVSGSAELRVQAGQIDIRLTRWVPTTALQIAPI
jgi:C4-dicarboxylate-specific signal transduction histidine kinase